MIRQLSGLCVVLLLLSSLVGCPRKTPPANPGKEVPSNPPHSRVGDKENVEIPVVADTAKGTAVLKLQLPEHTTTIKIDGKTIEEDESGIKDEVRSVLRADLKAG